MESSETRAPSRILGERSGTAAVGDGSQEGLRAEGIWAWAKVPGAFGREGVVRGGCGWRPGRSLSMRKRLKWAESCWSGEEGMALVAGGAGG